ncbi:hypothetical protein SBA7_380033 [Candidatus Sulfotelmatobacter sp. SbA7]|nr:hypothetical protein SBA7_380033 [Candidatus Sulfotelmatobacter sp. SbA7]
MPEGTDGSASSAGSPRGLPGAGTIRSGHPGAAQGSAGLGHNRFESPGGLRRSSQPEQRARPPGVGVDQRYRAVGGRDACKENRLIAALSGLLGLAPAALLAVGGGNH